MLLEQAALKALNKANEHSSLNHLLAIPIIEDEVSINAAVLNACQNIYPPIHLCQPDYRTTLARFCYSFVFDNCVIEEAQNYVNVHLLSTCYQCLLAYTSIRDAVISTCGSTFDHEGVKALSDALRDYDKVRITAHFAKLKVSQEKRTHETPLSDAEDVQIIGELLANEITEGELICMIWDLWLNPLDWFDSDEVLNSESIERLSPLIFEQTFGIISSGNFSSMIPRLLVKLISPVDPLRRLAWQILTEINKNLCLKDHPDTETACVSALTALTSGIISVQCLAVDRNEEGVLIECSRILVSVSSMFQLIGLQGYSDSWQVVAGKYTLCAVKFCQALMKRWVKSEDDQSSVILFSIGRLLLFCCNTLQYKIGENISLGLASLSLELCRNLITKVDSMTRNEQTCSLALIVAESLCRLSSSLASYVPEFFDELNKPSAIEIVKILQRLLVIFPVEYIKVCPFWDDGLAQVDLLPDLFRGQDKITCQGLKDFLNLSYLQAVRLEVLIFGRRSDPSDCVLVNPRHRDHALELCNEAFRNEKLEPHKSFEAYRDIVTWLLNRFIDDLLVYTYLSTCYASATHFDDIPKNLINIFVTRRLVADQDSGNIICLPVKFTHDFLTIYSLLKAVPIFIQYSYTNPQLVDSMLESILLSITEYSLLPTQQFKPLFKTLYHKATGKLPNPLTPLNPSQFVKPLTINIEPEPVTINAFLKPLVDNYSKAEIGIHLLESLILFVFRLFNLKLKKHGHPEDSDFDLDQKPNFTTEEKTEITRLYKSGQLGEDLPSISQLIPLIFPLTTSFSPIEIKKEFLVLLSAILNTNHNPLYSSLLTQNLVWIDTFTAFDTEIARTLGQLATINSKIPQEIDSILQGIDLSFEQILLWKNYAFPKDPQPQDILPETEKYHNTLYNYLVLSRNSLWYLKAILPTLDMLIEDHYATPVTSEDKFTASLKSMERSVWSVLVRILNSMPINAIKSSDSLPPTDLLNMYQEIYFSLFTALDKFMQHVTKQLMLASSNSVVLGIVEQVHLPFIRQMPSWAEKWIKWSYRGQIIAIQNLVHKQGLTLARAENSWSTQSTVGQAIREAATMVANLAKAMKSYFPQDRKHLPRDILFIATGKILRDPAKIDETTNIQTTTPENPTQDTPNEPLAQPSANRQNYDVRDTDDTSRLAKPTERKQDHLEQPSSGIKKTIKPLKSGLNKHLDIITAKNNKPNSTSARTYDVAMEMMQSWKNQRIDPQKKPIKAIELKTAIIPKASILVDGKGKPILPDSQESSAVSSNSKVPLLRKMTPQEKSVAVGKAFGGLQILLQQILAWDFLHLDKYELPELLHLPEKLPLSFDDEDSFRNYFKPLVLEECRCSILQERMEKKLESFPLVISKATLSGTWMLVTARSGKIRRNQQQNQQAPTIDDNPERAIINANPQDLEILPLKKHDLVMLVPTNVLNPTNPYEGRCLGDLDCPPVDGYFVAVVEKSDDQAGGPVTSVATELTQCKLRFPRCLPQTQAGRLGSSSVTISSAWLAYPIASLTTSVREFQSLFTASFSPIFKFILKPAKFGVTLSHNEASFKSRLHKKSAGDLNLELLSQRCNMNSSQRSAVKHAITADFGVALLQGPPGTGKTKTLLAIVAGIHAIKSNTKLLVCAPSNAAVDEVAARILKEGIVCPGTKPGDEQMWHPNCLRVGNPSRITRDEVREISLEEKLSNENQGMKDRKSDDLREELNKISKRLDEIELELKVAAAPQATTTTTVNTSTLMSERRQLLQNRKRMKDDFQGDIKSSKTRVKDGFIKNTDIFFTTLSGSASELLQSVTFDYVIVDEAAQAVELSGLIPLRHEIEKLILIGDPQQLPATVLSSSAKKFNYERSLFQRLQLCGVDVAMLSTQYRMRPEISEFPSKHFYKGKLLNDQSVISRPPLAFQVDFKSLFGPFKFFHLESQESRNQKSQSLCNRDEAFFILSLIQILHKNFIHQKNSNNLSIKDVAILTPYKQQVIELQRLLQAQGNLGEPLEVCTVDSFQGREKKIIIFSCVRALVNDDTAIPNHYMDIDDDEGKANKPKVPHNIGFVADIRRLNVAITRARDALWIVGNSNTLRNHETWASLINHAKSANSSPPISSDPFVCMEQNTLIDVKGSVEKVTGKVQNQATNKLISTYFSFAEENYLRNKRNKRPLPTSQPQEVQPIKLARTKPNDLSTMLMDQVDISDGSQIATNRANDDLPPRENQPISKVRRKPSEPPPHQLKPVKEMKIHRELPAHGNAGIPIMMTSPGPHQPPSNHQHPQGGQLRPQWSHNMGQPPVMIPRPEHPTADPPPMMGHPTQFTGMTYSRQTAAGGMQMPQRPGPNTMLRDAYAVRRQVEIDNRPGHRLGTYPGPDLSQSDYSSVRPLYSNSGYESNNFPINQQVAQNSQYSHPGGPLNYQSSRPISQAESFAYHQGPTIQHSGGLMSGYPCAAMTGYPGGQQHPRYPDVQHPGYPGEQYPRYPVDQHPGYPVEQKRSIHPSAPMGHYIRPSNVGGQQAVGPGFPHQLPGPGFPHQQPGPVYSPPVGSEFIRMQWGNSAISSPPPAANNVWDENLSGRSYESIK